MPSTPPERSDGLASAIGSLGIAVIVAVLVVVLSPSPTGDGTAPPTSGPSAPHPTISLDDLTADLSAALEEDPDAETVDVVTPDGVVTVVIPSTTTTTTTSQPAPPPAPSTTTTTTTSQVPRPTILPPDWSDDILDDLLNSVPTTIPEGAGGGP